MIKTEFEMKIEEILKKWDYNGSVCITKENEVVFEGAFGMADMENKIPNTRDTIFSIASVTKQFTAVCIMMLFEEGKLNINDTLEKYIPEYAYAEKITLRQMLNMSSGIPDMINEVIEENMNQEEKTTELSERDFMVYKTQECSKPFTLSEVLKLVNNRPLNFTPGSKLSYSNTNYAFLGAIVERVSKIPLSDFMMEHIFSVLEMMNTYGRPEKATSIGYGRYQDGIVQFGYVRDLSGDGCVVSTAKDLSIWLNAVLEKKLLKESSWEQCLTPVVNTESSFPNNYGFGWLKNGEWYQHAGEDMGYITHVFMSLECKITVSMIKNLSSPFIQDANPWCPEYEIMDCVVNHYISNNKIRIK